MDTYAKLLKTGFFPLCGENPPLIVPEEFESPGEAFLFQKFRGHLSLNAAIPLHMIRETMDNYAYSFYGEFVESSKNKEFRKICPDFYEYLFGNDELYVSYENFKELLEKVDGDPETKELVKNVREDFIIEDKPEFQLGYRGGKNEKGVYVFTHLKTGLYMTRPDGQEIFIIATYDGRKSNRFRQFFNLAKRMLIEEQNIALLAHLCIKRATVLLTDDDDTEVKNIYNSIFNGLPFHVDKKDNTVLPNETQFIEPKAFVEYQDGIHIGGDKKLTEIGKLVNTNPKAERITTGENYKEMSSIANRQRVVLTKLEEFADNVSEKGGIQLEFKLSGIPEKLPMETDPKQIGEGEDYETQDTDNKQF